MTSCCINFPFFTIIQTILLCLAISAATAPCCPASPGQTPVRSLASLGRRLMHQVCLLQLQDPPFRGSPLLPTSFASPWPPVTQTQALLISQPQMSPSVMQNKHPCPQVTIRLRTRISRRPRLRGDVTGVSSYWTQVAIAQCKGHGKLWQVGGRNWLASGWPQVRLHAKHLKPQSLWVYIENNSWPHPPAKVTPPNAMASPQEDKYLHLNFAGGDIPPTPLQLFTIDYNSSWSHVDPLDEGPLNTRGWCVSNIPLPASKERSQNLC